MPKIMKQFVLQDLLGPHLSKISSIHGLALEAWQWERRDIVFEWCEAVCELANMKIDTNLELSAKPQTPKSRSSIPELVPKQARMLLGQSRTNAQSPATEVLPRMEQQEVWRAFFACLHRV